MSILMSLTLRNLKLNKKRTIVTIIGIILSGAMICGVAALITSFQDLFVESAKVLDGNFHATFYDVPFEDKGVILNNASTESGMLSRDQGIAKPEGNNDPEKPYILLKSYDDKAFENMPVQLKSGRFPMREGEILISEQLAAGKSMDWEVGQEITLPIGNRVDNGEVLDYKHELSDTESFQELERKTFRITGIMERPRFASSGNPTYIAISYLDESLLGTDDTVNISVLLEKPSDIYQTIPQMAEEVGIDEYSYNNELLKWMGISSNENYNRMFTSLGLIIIVLIVIGSVTVIYNAFAISVSERKKQFGMLSSVGATANQIRKIVYLEGLILGLIGIPLGILSGIFGIGVTIKVISPMIQDSLASANVSLRLVISPIVIIVTVMFTAVIIMLSAFLPAKRASRISPIEAIRLITDINIKGKKLKTSRLTRWLFGFEGELALKNLKRNKKRYAATVFSLFISIVLFVSFSTFITYGFASSEMYFRDMPYDISVYKYDEAPEDAMEFFSEISKLEGVKEYSIPRRVHAQIIENDRDKSQFKEYIDKYTRGEGFEEYYIGFSIFTLNKETYDKYLKEIGLDPVDYNDTKKIEAILINKDLVDFDKYTEYEPADVSKGDILHLKEHQYGEDHIPAGFDVEIVKVTDQFPFGLTYNNNINLIVSEEDFETILSMMKADLVYSGPEEMYLSADSPDDVASAIYELNDNRFNSFVSVSNLAEVQKQMAETKLIISIFLYGFISLITLIGVTNIFNTISTNVALRRREFAMLKSVGLTPGGLNKVLRYESIFYGLKALLYGLPFSIAISLLMYNAVGHSFEFQFVLPWNSIIISIIGVFLITFATMIHAGRKMKHDNIADTLKQENL